ncbi:MAG: hypothetical protein A2020_06685 [Lentisphaerae bacterium GWF2_45_14]|nr:MAG: hypothetical protein A2020_06685 [Lentisphaerae bacterium GWF2_45_14]
MTVNEVLNKVFPLGSKVEIENNIVSGEGRTAAGIVQIIGTCNNTVIGVDEILALSVKFLEVMRENPGRPVLMMVDNNGQKMALNDELLGLNQYIAHLVKLQDMARRNSHKVIALVYGNSIAGGFIAFGLCAGDTYALEGSNTSVMALPAVARVTKLPLEYLEELSKTVAVFAPGVKNFYLAGGLQSVWCDDLNQCLENALKEDQCSDMRSRIGMERGGRSAAWNMTQKILDEQ